MSQRKYQKISNVASQQCVGISRADARWGRAEAIFDGPLGCSLASGSFELIVYVSLIGTSNLELVVHSAIRSIVCQKPGLPSAPVSYALSPLHSHHQVSRAQ